MKIQIAILALSALTIAAANAEDLKVSAGQYGGNVVWTLNDHNGSTSDTHHTFAGQLNLEVLGGVTYKGFCVDATRVALGGWHPFDKITTASLGTADPAGASKIGYLVSNVSPSIHTNDDAMALQLAIWDIIYDHSPNQVGSGTGHGDFFLNSIDGYTAAQTQNVVDKANAYAATTGAATAIYFKATGYQDNQSFAAPVPEPASMATMFLGGLAMLRRRKNRK